MNITGRIKRFALFTAATASERKGYVASFKTLEEAVAEAGRRRTGPEMRWQVIDNEDSKIVAEQPGAEPAKV